MKVNKFMSAEKLKELFIFISQGIINTYKSKWGKIIKIFDKVEWFEIDNVEGYFGWLDNEPDTIYLLFEGSDEKKDWWQNFKIWIKLKTNNIKNLFLKNVKEENKNSLIVPYGNIDSDIKVAKGFIEDYFKIRNFIQEKLKGYKKIISGAHSKGHTLTGYSLLDFQFNNPDFPKENLIGITEGGPRMGNKAFCDSFNKRVPYFFRIVNGEDYVTKVPLNIQFYWHFGIKIHIGFYNPICWIPFIRPIGGLYHYPKKYIKNIGKIKIKYLKKILSKINY